MPDRTLLLAPLLSPDAWLYVLVGVALGVIFGSLPGFTATMGLAVLTPFTFWVRPDQALAMLLGPAGLGDLQRRHPGHPAQHAGHASLDRDDLGRLSARAVRTRGAGAWRQRRRRVRRHPSSVCSCCSWPRCRSPASRCASVPAELRRRDLRHQHHGRRLGRVDAQGARDGRPRPVAGHHRPRRHDRLSALHLRPARAARRHLLHPGHGRAVRRGGGILPDGRPGARHGPRCREDGRRAALAGRGAAAGAPRAAGIGDRHLDRVDAGGRRRRRRDPGVGSEPPLFADAGKVRQGLARGAGGRLDRPPTPASAGRWLPRWRSAYRATRRRQC